MRIENAHIPADGVTVTVGPKINGLPYVKLDIGHGTGSRHSYLTPAEAKQVAYALLMTAERASN